MGKLLSRWLRSVGVTLWEGGGKYAKYVYMAIGALWAAKEPIIDGVISRYPPAGGPVMDFFYKASIAWASVPILVWVIVAFQKKVSAHEAAAEPKLRFVFDQKDANYFARHEKGYWSKIDVVND